MSVNLNKLLDEVKVLLAVGDEEWTKPGITSGITQALVIDWIQQHTYFLTGRHKFKFLQKLLSTDDGTLTLHSAPGLTTKTDIKVEDDWISIENGLVGTTKIEFIPLRDLQEYQYSDTAETVFCYETLDQKNNKRVFRFQSNQDGNTVKLVIMQYPNSVTAFPADFYLWFKYVLVAEGLLHKQSNNLEDVYQVYVAKAQQIENALVKKHASTVHYNYKIVTPHQNLQYRQWQSGGRAR